MFCLRGSLSELQQLSRLWKSPILNAVRLKPLADCEHAYRCDKFTLKLVAPVTVFTSFVP